jgi:hypothetical protein
MILLLLSLSWGIAAGDPAPGAEPLPPPLPADVGPDIRNLVDSDQNLAGQAEEGPQVVGLPDVEPEEVGEDDFGDKLINKLESERRNADDEDQYEVNTDNQQGRQDGAGHNDRDEADVDQEEPNIADEKEEKGNEILKTMMNTSQMVKLRKGERKLVMRMMNKRKCLKQEN